MKNTHLEIKLIKTGTTYCLGCTTRSKNHKKSAYRKVKLYCLLIQKNNLGTNTNHQFVLSNYKIWIFIVKTVKNTLNVHIQKY